MARIPSVTRTIQTTDVTVMCVDVTTAEVSNKTLTLPRTFKDEDAMLKAAKKAGETATCKFVQVVAHKVNEQLYGMTEADFIKYAHPMPPRSGNDTDDNGDPTDEYEDSTSDEG